MPDFGATPAEIDRYGNTLNLWQSLMLLQKWSPLVGYVQKFVAEADPFKKRLIVYDAAEWLASQTQAKVDDELVGHLADTLRTPEGEKLVQWLVEKVQGIKA